MNKRGSITKLLKAMEVGDTQDFPAERAMTVRAMASNIGFQMGRKYTGHNNLDNRTVEITREK